MISTTQQLHNLGQNLWLGCHNPVLKTDGRNRHGVQAAGLETRTAISTSQPSLSKPMLANLLDELKRSRLQRGKEDRN